MSEINLTPLRQRVLRIVHQQPGLTAQDLGYALDDLRDGGHGWNHPAQATRFGAKQATALINAGLIVAKRERVQISPVTGKHRIEECRAGWAFLYLTTKGSEVATGPQVNPQEEK